MPLSEDFTRRDLIEKHGTKTKPGYRLLHPGSMMGNSYRTPAQEKRLVRFGTLLQAGKHEEAQAFLDRVTNLTPTQRKMVQEDITAAASKRKRAPAKPKDKAVEPKEATKVEETATPVTAMAVVTEEEAEAQDYTLPAGITSRTVDAWLEEIERAQDGDTLEEVELRILEAFDDPTHPLQDELQDAILRRHREHFERDRQSVVKWLARRGIIRKHGNKGAPGYELLHPNTMLRGTRTPKQEKRIERLGSMLQEGDSEGAQALLDRTLNLSDSDRKLIQGQIGASSKGQDGGKSKEAPEHSGKAPKEAPKAPVAPKDTPKPPKAPEKPKPVPKPAAEEDEEYGPDYDDPVDMTNAPYAELQAYLDTVDEAMKDAMRVDDVRAMKAITDADNLPPALRSAVDKVIEETMVPFRALGGVIDLPQGGASGYTRPKESISKVALAKQDRALIFGEKKLTTAQRNAAMAREQRDPRTTAAGKHLQAGGSVDDAPFDGLWDAIQKDQDRFEISESDEGTASEVFFVRDTKLGTDHFFKRALNGSASGATDAGGNPILDDEGQPINPRIVGDGINEIVGSALGNAAFPDMWLPVQFAEDPSVVNPMIRMTHMGTYAKDRNGKNLRTNHKDGVYDTSPETGAVKVKAGTPPLADPKQALAIHIYDYLTANADRHPGNIASMEVDGKRVLIPIDNGATFHSMVQGVEGQEELDQSLLAPETVPYDVWQTRMGFDYLMGGAKGRYVRAEVVKAYKGDQNRLKADADEIIRKFKEVKTREIMADIRKQNGNLDPYEQANLDAAMKIWENRLKMIQSDDVAKVMS